MGAFFTNIHVHVPDVERPGAEHLLRERISTGILSGPFRPAAEGEAADRTVVIAPDGVRGWYVVFDEEETDRKALRGLAAALSVEPAAASISTLAADSDQFELTLYKGGRRADSIVVGSGSGGRQKRTLGRAAWKGLLTKEQIADVEKALRSGSPFAEESLSTFAQLLGWDSDLAHLGYSHIDEIGTRERLELRFCLGADAEKEKMIRFREGPPLLRSGQTEMSVKLEVGQPLGGFYGTIYNEAGAGKGLAVLIPWTAEAASLLDVRALRLAVGEKTNLEIPFERVEGGSVAALRAKLEELPLPGWPEWIGAESAFNPRRFDRVLQRARLWPLLTGTALKAGKVDLTVLYVPLGNPEKGAASFLYHVEVSGTD